MAQVGVGRVFTLWCEERGRDGDWRYGILLLAV